MSSSGKKAILLVEDNPDDVVLSRRAFDKNKVAWTSSFRGSTGKRSSDESNPTRGRRTSPWRSSPRPTRSGT